MGRSAPHEDLADGLVALLTGRLADDRGQACEAGERLAEGVSPRVSRGNERGWTRRLTYDADVVVYCPACDRREFSAGEDSDLR